MKRPLPRRPIALVGMPGAGKTTLGRLLAARLQLPFHDSDDEVVRETGQSIAAIFRTDGEAAFRAHERAVLARLLDLGPAVIATGGGTMVEPPTRALLLARSMTIWLDAATPTLPRRLMQSSPRPLSNGADLAEKLAAMAAIRKPFYAQADLRVTADDAVDNVLARLLTALEP